MDLKDLKPSPGSTHRKRRVGRGIGSGHGKTAGRGHKGLGSRSHGNTPPTYEGGQMPLQRRLPKQGFRRTLKNEARRAEFAIVNLSRLNDFEAGRHNRRRRAPPTRPHPGRAQSQGSGRRRS